MRIVVTGKEGQVVRALSEVGPRLGAEIVTRRPAGNGSCSSGYRRHGSDSALS